EPTDSAFLANWNETRNRGFYTAGVSEQVIQPTNSIRAVVQETQTVMGESGVRLRLLETAQTPVRSIPTGTVLTANAKFQSGRLQLKVTSIEFEGNIIPVDITVYDVDGQQGLYEPNGWNKYHDDTLGRATDGRRPFPWRGAWRIGVFLQKSENTESNRQSRSSDFPR